jgi:hypothetical protein
MAQSLAVRPSTFCNSLKISLGKKLLMSPASLSSSFRKTMPPEMLEIGDIACKPQKTDGFEHRIVSMQTLFTLARLPQCS